MTTETSTPTPAPAQADPAIDLEALALEYAAAAEAAQPFLDKMADIKARLLEALPLGSYQAGPLTVQVKAGARTLDAKKLEAAYPLADNPLFYKATLDTAAVKNLVAPIVLEQYMRQNQTSVVIK